MKRLAPALVRQIYKAKGKGSEIAKRFDVSLSCVSNIRTGKTWDFLTHASRRTKPRYSYAQKLTVEQVMAIRASTGTCRELGRKYGVSYQTISLIRCGHTWKTVKKEGPL